MVFQTLKGLATYLVNEKDRLAGKDGHCYVVVESPAQVVVYDKDGKEITRAVTHFYTSNNDELFHFYVGRDEAIHKLLQRFDERGADINKLCAMIEDKSCKSLLGESFYLVPKVYFTDVYMPTVRVCIGAHDKKTGRMRFGICFDNAWYRNANSYTACKMGELLEDHPEFIVTM